MRGMSRFTAGAVAVALSAGVLAGCGGGSGGGNATTATAGGTTGEPRMTVAEYRMTANGICRSAHVAMNDIAAPTATPESFKSYLEKVLVVGRGQVDGLSGLYPPVVFEDQHQALLASGTDGIDFLEGVVTDINGGATADEIQTALDSPAFTRVASQEDRAAIAMGLQECAKD